MNKNNNDYRNITSYVLMGTFSWISLYSVVSQLSKYGLILGISLSGIGIINSAYGFSQTILRIPIGTLADKKSKQKIFVIIGLLFNAIGMLHATANPSFDSLLFMRFAAGIASATWVNHTALIVSYFPTSKKSIAISINNFVTKLGQLLAMLLGGYLVSKDIKYVFYLGFASGVLALLASFTLKDVELVKTNLEYSILDELKKIFTDKRLIVTSIIACIIQTVIYGSVFSMTPIYASILGSTNAQLALNTFIYIMPQILITILVGTTIKKYASDKSILLVGVLLISIGTLSIRYINSLEVLYIILFIKGIGNGLGFTILMDMGLRDIPNEKTSIAMGVYQSIYGLGIIFGPIIAGFIGEYISIEYSFTVLGIIGLISLLFMREI